MTGGVETEQVTNLMQQRKLNHVDELADGSYLCEFINLI